MYTEELMCVSNYSNLFLKQRGMLQYVKVYP